MSEITTPKPETPQDPGTALAAQTHEAPGLPPHTHAQHKAALPPCRTYLRTP